MLMAPGRHEVIRQTCRDAEIHPKKIKRVNDLLTALANVASSDGFAIMPSEVANIASSHVKFLPIQGFSASVVFHTLVARDESRKVIRAFLNECKRIIETKTS